MSADLITDDKWWVVRPSGRDAIEVFWVRYIHRREDLEHDPDAQFVFHQAEYYNGMRWVPMVELDVIQPALSINGYLLSQMRHGGNQDSDLREITEIVERVFNCGRTSDE